MGINWKKIEGRKNIFIEFDEILENYWKEILIFEINIGFFNMYI